MKKIVMTLGLALAPVFALATGISLGDTPVTTPAPTAAPAPTPKPLYVDYVPPDWAKAKEHITLEQAKKWVNDKTVLFCDARGKGEYDQGHIPGAIPLPTGEFEKYFLLHYDRIKKARKLVTYCHGIGCRLSEKSANSLVDKGFKNVAVFFGGWPQWSEHKLPIETGDTFASDVAVVPTPAPAKTAAAMPAPMAISPAPMGVSKTPKKQE